MANRSMLHLNGNLLCAVDVETTGVTPGHHDLVQICVLPLNSELKPFKDILPFYMDMQPKRPENIDPNAMSINKLKYSEILLKAIDPYKAADLFEEWFERIRLPFNKRISPLAQNWPFDRGFIIDWLGQKTFEYIFDGRFRDTMSAALFCNDRSCFANQPAPYPKVNIAYLASQLKIEHQSLRLHDALQDCIVTAEIYRRMMGYSIS